MSTLEKEFAVGDKTIAIRLGDLTLVKADAIVNSENHDLVMDAPGGTSVSAAVRRRGGEELAARARILGPLKPGEAVATGPGALPARMLIHAAVVRLKGELRWTSAALIRRSTLNALRCAAREGCRTVAMPAFGVGTARFPDRAAARLMLRTVVDYLRGRTPIERVTIALLTPSTFIAFFERSLQESLQRDPLLELTVEARQGGLTYRITDKHAASPSHRVTLSAETRALVASEAHRLFARTGPRGVGANELEAAGRRWAGQVLPPSVREYLAAHPGGTLVVRHGTALASLPFELLHDGVSTLCRRLSVSRQLLSKGAEEAVHHASGRGSAVGRLVVIADPTEDLPGARAEGEALLGVDAQGEGVLRAELLAGRRATVRRALQRLDGARAVHFCGHGDDGGWHLADGLLRPGELGKLQPPPTFVCNNCCPPAGDRDGTALAQAVLRAGVAVYLAAAHPPVDGAAAAFGLHVWQHLAEGADPVEAVHHGRQVLARNERAWGASWACYVLFGNATP